MACIAVAPKANAQGNPPLVSIVVMPVPLVNGSPFLLTVKLAGKASALKATWIGRQILFFPGKSDGAAETWYALAGVDVETAPGSYPLDIEATTAAGVILHTTRPLQVAAAHYHTAALKVAENFVAPDALTQKQIAEDQAVKDRTFAHSANQPEWSGDFAKPVQAQATDSFGTRRTFNGKLASIHRGMDFRAPSGTPVAAANSGSVILARKLFYEGNCVVIDHGQGFMTIYMHLSRVDVTEGAGVGKGQRLGLSGATGRVTGLHLHFAARWQGAYVDPAGLFALRLTGRP